jgi:hypothetical protein
MLSRKVLGFCLPCSRSLPQPEKTGQNPAEMKMTVNCPHPLHSSDAGQKTPGSLTRAWRKSLGIKRERSRPPALHPWPCTPLRLPRWASVRAHDWNPRHATADRNVTRPPRRWPARGRTGLKTPTRKPTSLAAAIPVAGADSGRRRGDPTGTQSLPGHSSEGTRPDRLEPAMPSPSRREPPASPATHRAGPLSTLSLVPGSWRSRAAPRALGLRCLSRPSPGAQPRQQPLPAHGRK